MEITYDLIKPILFDSHVEESKMFCKFKSKKADVIVESTAVIHQEQNTKTKLINIVKNSVINEVKRTITNQLIKLIGGTIASTASSVATTAIDGSRKAIRFTPGEKRDAIVDAFKFVANQFHYDEHLQEWVMMNTLSDFEQHIISNPIEKEYDRTVLAKCLIEIATLEDELSHEEESFLQSILPGKNILSYEMEMGGAVSQIELQEVSVSARKSIYLTAAVVSILNRKLTSKEKERLSNLAVGLNVLEAEANALMKVAQGYVVENAIATTSMDKKMLLELSDDIHMSHDDAERAVINYKRRM